MLSKQIREGQQRQSKQTKLVKPKNQLTISKSYSSLAILRILLFFVSTILPEVGQHLAPFLNHLLQRKNNKVIMFSTHKHHRSLKYTKAQTPNLSVTQCTIFSDNLHSKTGSTEKIYTPCLLLMQQGKTSIQSFHSHTHIQI